MSFSEEKKPFESLESFLNANKKVLFNGEYGVAPFGSQFGFGVEFFWGEKYLYNGLFFRNQVCSVDEKYNSHSSSYSLFGLGFTSRFCYPISIFEPYAQVGLGGTIATYEVPPEKSGGLSINFSTETGCDFSLRNWIIEIFYRLDYFSERGASDSFGVSFGYWF